MAGYYADKLSARKLQQCYQLAPLRVRQYLEAEILHVLGKIHPGDIVLEMGCGYGRVLKRLAERAGAAAGVDTSRSSLVLAEKTLGKVSNCYLLAMDAVALGFRDATFDVVACIQNGISAFKVDQGALLREGLRVTKPGGRVLFSSYSARFWDARLEWFDVQAEHGLIGEIDRTRTCDGVIVCKDGFRATTVGPDEFTALASSIGAQAVVEEVDGSSLFCEMRAPRVR